MLQTLQNLALALWSLGSARIRRSKTSHLPDCGLCALRACGRSCADCGFGALARHILLELRRLWARGAGAPEQPASGFWTLQTLQNLALARLSGAHELEWFLPPLNFALGGAQKVRDIWVLPALELTVRRLTATLRWKSPFAWWTGWSDERRASWRRQSQR